MGTAASSPNTSRAQLENTRYVHALSLVADAWTVPTSFGSIPPPAHSQFVECDAGWAPVLPLRLRHLQ